jgi:hypothetical protein
MDLGYLRKPISWWSHIPAWGTSGIVGFYPFIGICIFYLGFFMGYSDPTLLSYIEPGSNLIISQQNPSKTIDPSGRPKGNTTHRVYCAISHEITVWVAAILRCLQPRSEWISSVVLYNIYSFILTYNCSSHSIHACGIPDLTS